jgi:hypothetical protein
MVQSERQETLMTERYDAQWQALKFLHSLGGEMFVELTDVWAKPSAYVLLDATQQGLCTHQKAGEKTARFMLTDAGRRRVEAGPRACA